MLNMQEFHILFPERGPMALQTPGSVQDIETGEPSDWAGGGNSDPASWVRNSHALPNARHASLMKMCEPNRNGSHWPSDRVRHGGSECVIEVVRMNPQLTERHRPGDTQQELEGEQPNILYVFQLLHNPVRTQSMLM